MPDPEDVSYPAAGMTGASRAAQIASENVERIAEAYGRDAKATPVDSWLLDAKVSVFGLAPGADELAEAYHGNEDARYNQILGYLGDLSDALGDASIGLSAMQSLHFTTDESMFPENPEARA